MNNNRGIMLLVFGLTAMTVVTASLKGAISYVAVENSGVREATGVSDTGFQLNNSFQPMQNYSGLTPYKAGSRVYDSQYINSAVSFKVTGQDLVSPVNNIEARFAFTAVDADSPSGFRGQNFVFRPTAGSVITSPISFTFRVGSLSASSQLGQGDYIREKMICSKNSWSATALS